MVRSRTYKDRIADILIYAAVAMIALLSLLPIINTVAISLSNSSKAAAGIVTFYPLGFNLESYKNILQEKAFFNSFLISVQRVTYSTILVFFVAVITAYPLSKSTTEFKLRNVYMWLIVFTMMFAAPLIPFYLTVKGLQLRGSIWALVLPGVVNQYLIILVMNYFKSLPKELDECASIDGAGPWLKLFRIYIPLSKPILATIVLFNIVFHWNAFFDGLIFMNRVEQYPLQTYIQQLVVMIKPSEITDSEALKNLANMVSTRTLNAAKIVITMLPILALYPFMQNYFISGIMLGSVKE